MFHGYNGLTTPEVVSLQQKWGFNEIKDRSKKWPQILWEQVMFLSMILMLLVFGCCLVVNGVAFAACLPACLLLLMLLLLPAYLPAAASAAGVIVVLLFPAPLVVFVVLRSS